MILNAFTKFLMLLWAFVLLTKGSLHFYLAFVGGFMWAIILFVPLDKPRKFFPVDEEERWRKWRR